jgi:hypothetical protein
VVQRKQNLTYLLRNNIVVNLNNVIMPVDQLQVKFELIVKSMPLLKKIKNSDGSIIAFDSTISCMTVSDELIVLGSF